jgi:hypothetical protein
MKPPNLNFLEQSLIHAKQPIPRFWHDVVGNIYYCHTPSGEQVLCGVLVLIDNAPVVVGRFTYMRLPRYILLEAPRNGNTLSRVRILPKDKLPVKVLAQVQKIEEAEYAKNV